jgi:lipooligosaccharide transport system ATP-binding protein
VLDHGKKIAEGTPRDLIAQHLEPDVVEVFGNGALALVNSPIATLAQRVETSGETVFFYTQDALIRACARCTDLPTWKTCF